MVAGGGVTGSSSSESWDSVSNTLAEPRLLELGDPFP